MTVILSEFVHAGKKYHVDGIKLASAGCYLLHEGQLHRFCQWNSRERCYDVTPVDDLTFWGDIPILTPLRIVGGEKNKYVVSVDNNTFCTPAPGGPLSFGRIQTFNGLNRVTTVIVFKGWKESSGSIYKPTEFRFVTRPEELYQFLPHSVAAEDLLAA